MALKPSVPRPVELNWGLGICCVAAAIGVLAYLVGFVPDGAESAASAEGFKNVLRSGGLQVMCLMHLAQGRHFSRQVWSVLLALGLALAGVTLWPLTALGPLQTVFVLGVQGALVLGTVLMWRRPASAWFDAVSKA